MMPVCVIVGMFMFHHDMLVRMTMFLQLSQDRPAKHQDGTHKKGKTWIFLQQKEGRSSADKRCRRIIKAGSGRAKPTLGVDVEINAQTIGKKSEQQSAADLNKRFTCEQRTEIGRAHV